MAEAARITVLKDMPPREGGRYVQYWMQQAMRAEDNPALDHAVTLANELGLPVLVSFGLTGRTSPPYPDANARHYAFLLEGLADVATALAQRGIAFVARYGAPDAVALDLAEEAAVLVADRGYLKPQRAWQTAVAETVGCRFVRVETDAVVPVEVASGKHEFAARTLRPKIMRLWDEYLVDHRPSPLRHKATGLEITSELDFGNIDKILKKLRIDHAVKPVIRLRGGLKAARARLRRFLGDGLDGYAEKRSAPELSHVSHLSPYLHFGQISPVEIALAAREGRGERGDRDSFLEELIVRRELAFNHVLFAENYDRYDVIPDWARKTLAEHANDARPHLYDQDALEAADTHDHGWNAAMREMRDTGYMHNRLRMYWGKKIIEWSPTPERAFETALALNNKFFVDGRDANSFTNIGWLFGLHDRPWFRRAVFGSVRYMGDATLKKFDLEAYIRTVDRLCEAEAG